jgi:hypothetical protein
MRAGAAQDLGAEPARCGRKQISTVPNVSGDGLRPEQALRSHGEHHTAQAHAAWTSAITEECVCALGWQRAEDLTRGMPGWSEASRPGAPDGAPPKETTLSECARRTAACAPRARAAGSARQGGQAVPAAHLRAQQTQDGAGSRRRACRPCGARTAKAPGGAGPACHHMR